MDHVTTSQVISKATPRLASLLVLLLLLLIYLAFLRVLSFLALSAIATFTLIIIVPLIVKHHVDNLLKLSISGESTHEGVKYLCEKHYVILLGALVVRDKADQVQELLIRNLGSFVSGWDARCCQYQWS